VDDIVVELADICRRITFEELPESVIATATLRLVDTLGCALGGANSAAAAIGRRLAPRLAPGDPAPARAIGTAARQTSIEAAGFVNSTMIRYLDFNDSYPGSHPSDALGPIISLADATNRSGRDLVTALVVAYEVLIRCVKATRLRELGWDQGFVIGLGVAAGTSVLMGLDEERTRHALSIVAVSNVPLRATRAGQLSMWKGAATAYAARNAFFATMLAADGMTSPEAPIQGRHGLQELVTGPISLSPFTGDEDSYLIRQVRTKYWPVESHVQGVVWAAIELREQVSIDEADEVVLAVAQLAWHETASEADKWDPRSRETADHSLCARRVSRRSGAAAHAEGPGGRRR
jgi:2-methylcitrate dehydratase